jgi:hypothetical protein
MSSGSLAAVRGVFVPVSPGGSSDGSCLGWRVHHTRISPWCRQRPGCTIAPGSRSCVVAPADVVSVKQACGIDR